MGPPRWATRFSTRRLATGRYAPGVTVVSVPRNGRRVGLIGAGPASLTVARDLTLNGYECVVFEKDRTSGGLMRTNIPSFRLPASVLDEETERIIALGVEVRYGEEVTSLKGLLADGGFDAVFVGTGAPRGKDLEIPGRRVNRPPAP